MRALQRVEAVGASPVEAERLAVSSGSPILLIRRSTYLGDGRCCAFTRILCCADTYDLASELGGAV